jgi:hypothetical protein
VILAGEATIKVKPGHVYHIKLSVISMGHFGTTLEKVNHEDGVKLIEKHKLKRIQ